MYTNHLVTQANELIEAKHTQSLTAREHKMILIFVSMIQPDDEDFKVYSITASQFHKMLNIKGRENYDRIYSMTKKIMSRTIEIERNNGGYLLVNWASHIEYIPGEARIEFSFDPKLKPYLLQLKRAFKSYRLENILILNSYYSIRLYELFKKWQNIGKWETSLENLKSLMGVYQKSYNLYGNFKSKILNSSVDELNEKTDIDVSFIELKEGRKITGISFSIKGKRNLRKITGPKEIDENSNDSDVKKTIIEKMNDMAQNYEININVFQLIHSVASRIYENDDIENELLNLVELTNLKSDTNPIGFMIHIIKDKEKLFNNGDNPSLEFDLYKYTKEVIPEWFKEKNENVAEKEKTPEELEQEIKEKEEIDKLLKKYS